MSKQENRRIRDTLAGLDRESRILDVGCGYGEKIRILQQLGFKNITGVEKNDAIVADDNSRGLPVVTLGEFEREYSGKGRVFDVIVMSHIIEHFQYQDLKNFMEYYLGFLRDGGYLLVVTPTLNDDFFDNFDHVKPYTPAGPVHLRCEKNREPRVS